MTKCPNDLTKPQLVHLKPQLVQILWDEARKRAMHTKWQDILRELILELEKENEK